MKTPGMNILFGAICLTVCVAVTAEARQAPAVTVTEVPGAALVATGINDKGQVIAAALVDGSARALLVSNGAVIDIMADCPNCTGAVGYDISNTGQVVGVAILSDGSQGPFSWKDGVWTNMASLPGSGQSIAWTVNDAGQIAGISLGGGVLGSTGTFWAAANSAPAVTQSAQIFDINNRGQMAGVIVDSTCATPKAKAVIEHAGTVTVLDPDCSKSTIAYAINDSGDVAVGVGDGSGTKAVLYKGGQAIELSPAGDFVDTLPGRSGLNAAGDVAGVSSGGISGCYQQGTVWVREGRLLLPALEQDANGCHASFPYGNMNIHGQIPGMANDKAVVWHVDIDRFAPTVTLTATPVKPAKGGAPMLITGRVVDEKPGPSSASGVATATYRLIDEYGLIQPSGTLSLSPAGEFSMTLPLDQVKGGDKDGRLYTLEITTSDRAGNSATSITNLIVKHGPTK